MPKVNKKTETFRGVAHPWLCDSMGHMNTQHYCVLFDGATFHFLALIDGPRMMRQGMRGWADAKQTIEYRREILSGDLLLVTTELLHVGRSSLIFRHEMLDLEDGELRATCENTTVHFDLMNRVSLPLDEGMRKKAREHLDDNANAN